MSEARSAWCVAAVLLLLVLAAYAGALGHPLVFDDLDLGRQVFAGIGAAPELRPRWLSSSTFWWTTALAGVDVQLLRLQNLMLHAAAAAAIFLLCRELVRGAEEATTIAGVAAAAFALHPAAVYGVAYLAQRSIIMATLFSALSLYAWLRGRIEASPRWLAAAVVFYVLALLSKEHAIALPAVAVLLSAAMRENVTGTRRQWWTAMGAMAIAALATVWSMRTVVGAAYEPQLGLVMGEAAAAAPAEQLHLASAINQAEAFFRYVLTWLVPLPGLMSIDLRPPASPLLLSACAGAGFIVWGAWGLWHLAAPDGRRMLGLAMITPWLLFFTEFAAVRMQEPLVLYRSYLWGIGFAFFLAGGLLSFQRRTLAIVGVAAIAVSGFGLRDRLDTFASPLALWDDAVRKLASDAVPYADRPIINRGVALMREGREAEALADFDRAAAINPASPVVFFNRAVLHAQAGRTEQARADLAQAQRLQRNAL